MFTIGHNQYLALPDGAGRFRQDFSGPVLLRGSHHRTSLTSTGLSPSVGRLSSPLRLRLDWLMWALQPPAAVAAGFGLFRVRSPLLAESLYCFLFLGVLRCFSSPRWLPKRISARKQMGFPIRIPADLGFGAAPRSFSQLYTSFIAWLCLGIHHTPFSAFTYMTCTTPRRASLEKQ